ncbi:MAG: general secretion pathway protein GspK [Gammaproteobacteria bacterium]|nr:general secretion pathway protein GspK [Gammaproteobacteria bacterium]
MISKQQGVALILVLWVVVLLTVMATSLTAIQRSETQLTQLALASSRAEAALTAGVYYAVQQLQVVNPQWRWQGDGRPYLWQFQDYRLRITIQDERGLLNPNSVDRPLWSALLQLAGSSAREAEQLYDQLQDWRDRDQLQSLNGAEDALYIASGVPYGAADEPLVSIEELLLLLQMSPQLYQQLRPLLSLRAAAQPDWMLAPLPLLQAAQLAQSGDPQQLQQRINALTFGAAMSENSLSSQGDTFRIVVWIDAIRGEQVNDGQYSVAATLQLTGLERAGYHIIGWQRAPLSRF